MPKMVMFIVLNKDIHSDELFTQMKNELKSTQNYHLHCDLLLL